MQSRLPLRIGKYGLWITLMLYGITLFGDISTAMYNITITLLVIFGIALHRETIKAAIFTHNKWFFIFYGIFCVSLMAAAFGTGIPDSITYTCNYVLFTLPLWVLFLILKTDKENLAAIQVAMVLASIGYIVRILSLGDAVFAQRISVFFGSPNRLAMVFEIILPFLIALCYDWFSNRKNSSWRRIGFVLTLVTIVGAIFGLVITQSRGGFLGFGVGLLAVVLIYILQKKYAMHFLKKAALFFSIIICLACSGAVITLNVFHRSYDQERMLLMKSTFQMWQDHNVVGVGMGNWQKEYQQRYILPEAKEPTLPHPHNNIASFFSMTGTIGGVGYLIFSVGSMIFLIKKIDEETENPYIYAMLWVCIAIFTHGMVDNTLYNKDITRMYYGMWGITLYSLCIPALKK